LGCWRGAGSPMLRQIGEKQMTNRIENDVELSTEIDDTTKIMLAIHYPVMIKDDVYPQYDIILRFDDRGFSSHWMPKSIMLHLI
jgi:hypothetical protein